ncbi:MAG: alpha/beta hydrolase-fold protein [Urechidicola sp.]|nr:alpha/beta hydrolase-fold protein [Urechidicola sp.]
MKNIKRVLLLLTIMFCNSLFAQNIPITKSSTPLTIGKTVEIYSTILNEDRVLNIYLPHGYFKDSLKEYPVIFLLDGSIDEDFIHIAGVVQFGSFSWINMLPESIVVGISNIDRKRDFTFHTNDKGYTKEFPTTGHSAPFIEFIEKELQPFIKSNYKTNNIKTLIGQSLGGLLATEILFKKPDLFDNYIIVSPSLWWDNESLLDYTPANYKTEKSIYVAVGKEGEIMEREAKALYDKLKPLNTKNSKVYYQFFEKQNHADALHLAVYDAFEKLFK